MSSSTARSATGLTVVLLGGLVLGIASIAGALTGSASSAALTSLALASESCTLTGPIQGLSPEQAQNAEVIVATAFADSGENQLAARIALMVADTESGLHDLGPQPSNDGSLGLFQQRASEGWGTTSQEMDPAQATAMFVNRLVALHGWESLAPWTAAQLVQRSVHSDGSNYKAHWPIAGQVLSDALALGNIEGSCGQGVDGGLAGPAGAHGLPAGYAVPSGTPPDHALAVDFALAQLGKPYVWGAAGPTAFDCSGLTMAAWATVGVRLDHYTVTQLKEGRPVSAVAAVAGDLVLIPGSDPPGPGLPGHVGLYLGDGLVVSAIDPQFGVAVQTWDVFTSGGIDGVVDPAPDR